MATTSRPFEVGAVGVRDTAGAVVASAKVRWYSPGTLTPATAYTDAACATPATAPLTAGAGGKFSLFFLEPVRVIIKDSTETTTYYDDIASLNRHDSVYVTHTSFNSGAETTLESILTTLGTNLGANGAYLESAGATARPYGDWLGQLVVSVKDFGATGDGTTDDTTACQAAYTRVKARGGGWVFWPLGTYKITSAISLDTVGVSTMGAGRGIAVVKNFSTTGNAFTVNITAGSSDCKMTFRDFSITANTTTSGAGISFTNALTPKIQNVGVALHRTGIGGSSASGAVIRDVHIDSTDNNAAAIGVSLGNGARLHDSEITSSTDNGTGVSAGGTDAKVVDCSVTNFATGVLLSGQGAMCRGGLVVGSTTGVSVTAVDCMVRDTTVDTATTGISMTGARAVTKGCVVLSATTGVSLGATSAAAVDNVVRSCTTGFSVGAVASCQVTSNIVSGNTTDLSVNASATALIEHSNGFTTVTDTTSLPHSWLKDRGKVLRITKAVDSTTTPSITPTPATCDIYVASMTSAGVMTSVTVNATTSTGLAEGQYFVVVLSKTAGSGTPVPTFNAQYSGVGVAPQLGAAGGGMSTFHFVWRTGIAKWVCISVPGGGTPPAAGTDW